MDKKLDNLLGFLFELNDSLPINKFSVNINFLQLMFWPFKQYFPESGYKYSAELLQHLFFSYEERLTTQVEHLIIDARYCVVKRELAKDIAQFCKDIFNLSSLYLDFKYNQVTNLSGEILASIFVNKKCLQTIHLDFENNLIGDKGLKQILQNIGNLPLVLSLNLNLRQNELTTKSAKRISQLLTKQQLIENLLVNIEQNNISDEGVFLIVQSIQQLSQLKFLSLTLGGNPYVHFEKLGTLRSFYLPSLQSFQFSLINQQFEGQPVYLIHNIIKNSFLLENLYVDLRVNSLNDQSILFLAASLAKYQFIMSLSLNFISNSFSEMSLKKLVAVCYGFNLLSQAKILHSNFQQNGQNNNNNNNNNLNNQIRHNIDCVCYKLQKKVEENIQSILTLTAYEKIVKPYLVQPSSSNMSLQLNYWDLLY